jgi:hypothetical protein
MNACHDPVFFLDCLLSSAYLLIYLRPQSPIVSHLIETTSLILLFFPIIAPRSCMTATRALFSRPFWQQHPHHHNGPSPFVHPRPKYRGDRDGMSEIDRYKPAQIQSVEPHSTATALHFCCGRGILGAVTGASWCLLRFSLLVLASHIPILRPTFCSASSAFSV